MQLNDSLMWVMYSGYNMAISSVHFVSGNAKDVLYCTAKRVRGQKNTSEE